MSLMDDFMLLMRARVSTFEEAAAINRLRAFIEQHEPWLPPQQEGFGPWIEYKPGDKGPRVGDKIRVLLLAMRQAKVEPFDLDIERANVFQWGPVGNPIVAYCVKLEDNE